MEVSWNDPQVIQVMDDHHLSIETQSFRIQHFKTSLISTIIYLEKQSPHQRMGIVRGHVL